VTEKGVIIATGTENGFKTYGFFGQLRLFDCQQCIVSTGSPKFVEPRRGDFLKNGDATSSNTLFEYIFGDFIFNSNKQ